MGSCTGVLRDEYIPVPTGVGYNNRLKDILSVVEPSDIPLADVEFCPPSLYDSFPAAEDRKSINVGL